MDDYTFRTEPFPHQRKKFYAYRAAPFWGHLWEMGTGKTKEDIDQTSWNYLQGILDGYIILAPNGVHENWITDELPKHMPDEVMRQARLFAYHSSKAQTKTHMKECEDLLNHKGLSILAISYDAAMTKPTKKWMGGKSYVEKFLRLRKTRMTLDESSRIKNAGAKRTRAICAIGKRAEQRRIYTGTPVPNGPFDIYPQIKFLSEDFWKEHGFASYSAFKTHFGVWKTDVNSATGGRFEYCVAYKNLDELYEIIGKITDRLTKEDVLDLPEKLYSPMAFTLSPQQAKLYKELKEESIAWLGDDETISAEMPIVKLLRLQQIICGWVPRSEEDIQSGDDEPIYEIEGPNPRLNLLGELVEDMPHPAIIWARFRGDVDRICDKLESLNKTFVRYDGKVPPGPERAEAKRRFNDGEVQFFVGNPAVGGQGLTLIRAKTTIYYSNSFDLDHRLQSEDRNHRIGQDVNVNYIDLIARGTVDVQIIGSLRRKISVASIITGDTLRDWL